MLLRYVISLKKIVIEEGALTEICTRDEIRHLGTVFQTINLEELHLPRSITYISPREFRGAWCSIHGVFRYFDNHPPLMTVYGYKGSYAEEYANENGIPFVAYDEPSDWATDEVSKATELEFVPVALGERYPLAITRSEFCNLSVNFLATQYDTVPTMFTQKPTPKMTPTTQKPRSTMLTRRLTAPIPKRKFTKRVPGCTTLFPHIVRRKRTETATIL